MRRMPTPDDPIKTSLRIPRQLHAELEAAAERDGLTLNGEMVIRLRLDPHANEAATILRHIEARDTALMDGLKRHNGALWSTVERADGVLERVAKAMAHVQAGTDAAALKREVEFVRELIDSLRAHR